MKICKSKFNPNDWKTTFNINKAVISELEKIKEEIKDLLFSYGYLDIHTNNEVLEIIDNHISELKGGDNNGR